MVIVISGGKYSEYWEHWYESKDEGVTHADLGQRLLEHVDEADRIFAARAEAMNYEEMLLGLCGLTPIRPDLGVDTGYSFPCNKESVGKLAEQLIGGNP